MTEPDLRALVADVLALEPPVDWASVHYQTTPGWDSLVHMALVARLEEAFGITLTDADIEGMDSYARLRDVLAGHGIALDAGTGSGPGPAPELDA